MMNVKASFVLILAVVFSAGATVFLHYGDCYSASLGSYSGWIHEQPRFYEEELGNVAPNVRDHVGFVGDRFNGVTLLSATEPLIGHESLTDFVDGSNEALRAEAVISRLERCEALFDGTTTWACADWTITRDEGPGHQRAYFAELGNTKFIVLFTAAPPEFFPSFGDPRRWLYDIEWRGPGISYSF